MEQSFDFEVWQDVDGYEGLYQVSNLGRVKSLKRIDTKPYKDGFRTHIVNERILKPFATRTGYLLVKLTKDKKEKSYQVHRLVAIAFIPNPENKPQINHKNGKREDNNLLNLEWVTASENARHKIDVLGFKFSDETKAKMRAKKLGKKLSQEQREKMSIKRKGQKPVNNKPVRCIETGKIFFSAQEASKKLNISRSAVSKSIKRNTRAGGFYWEYI